MITDTQPWHHRGWRVRHDLHCHLVSSSIVSLHQSVSAVVSTCTALTSETCYISIIIIHVSRLRHASLCHADNRDEAGRADLALTALYPTCDSTDLYLDTNMIDPPSLQGMAKANAPCITTCMAGAALFVHSLVRDI